MARIVLSATGAVNFPEGGGHLFFYLQYLHALRSLGCDVYWLERLYTMGDRSKYLAQADTLARRLRDWGMEERVIFYSQSEDNAIEYVGVSQAEAEAVFRSAELLINFNHKIDPGLLSHFRRTAMIDIDPGLLQFWISMGQLQVPRHDLYFTIGETVGRSALFPSCGLDWVHMRPPVCLDLWPYKCDPDAEVFTTISSWWGGHGKGEWVTDGDAEVYENNKRVGFLQYVELPRRAGETLELALSMGEKFPEDRQSIAPPEWPTKRLCPDDVTDYQGDEHDRRKLEHNGWIVRPAAEVAGSPELYQIYIRGSRGEFSCAKPAYLRLQTAWVSDRTLCYLASGKPAVVQNTGPSAFLPGAEGIFRFHSMEEAVEAFAAIRSDYTRHSRAAREVAGLFEARAVLAGMLDCAFGGLRKGMGDS